MSIGESELHEAAVGQSPSCAPEVEGPATDAEQRFEIRDEATAAWALGKINAARAQLTCRQETAAAWVEEARREVERLETRFLPELRAWGLQNLPAGKKTIRLISGRLEYRNKPGRFVLVSADEALLWAKANLPDAVTVKESVSAGALARYAKQTGEAPAGVMWVPEQENDTFTVK